ncbi:MAG: 23S rRNA (adenine(2503)-C(2))-methyltransferase RlmN, partial [Ruthenibacterium sp.]
MNQIRISSLPMPQLAELIGSLGQPAFRAKQIFSWLHEKQAVSFSEMTNLPKSLVETLRQTCIIETLVI